MPDRNPYSIRRSESRIPMEIPVVLDGHRHIPGAEHTFTENVRGTVARVAYCQPIHGDGYAIGLEFLEPTGRWIAESAN